ncbi:hypothetical protein M422DRAFT_70980 [Sphaerobolus stellatus SS14]|uniref:Uncharacterized protein n=1 Tax=Sphaerobolus stellatus (strain SS14) TaxID=990650 RepID=A0A0C9UYR9_SPHS4|nr:hypothetical protein M422DRAFT_70980 [Sphaerobolus stellatus SS14]
MSWDFNCDIRVSPLVTALSLPFFVVQVDNLSYSSFICMARPLKYTSPEDAHLARLKSKREYYRRNRKLERKKSLERYKKAKAAGKKRTPAADIKHRPPINTRGRLLEHIPHPSLQVNGKTNLRKALKALWERLLPGGEPCNMVQTLETRFSKLLEQCTPDEWAANRAKINDEIKHVEETDVECTNITKEAWRRDPSGRSKLFKQCKQAENAMEALSGLLFESRVWLDDGGSNKLLELYDGRKLVWQRYS